MAPTSRPDPAREFTRSELESRLASTIGSRGDAYLSPARLVQFDDADLATITARLIRLRQACGCSAGAVCMIAALLVGSWLAVRHGAVNIVEVGAMSAKVLGEGFVAAAIGKVAGIVGSRMRWRIERDRLFRRIARGPKGGGYVVLR